MASVDDYRRFWDGSETGWKLSQYDQSVWLAEYFFGESGPTEIEFAALVEFVAPLPGESVDEMRDRFRGCDGCAIGRPIGATELKGLQASGLNVALTEVRTDHHVVLMPSGGYFFIQDPVVREQVAQRMIEAGCEIEKRSLA
ncbi:MAG: hypothetical protein KDB05_08000 [Planctomycetales bacterium]|nr:hypothetical protein [Planctomycetales bacterium]